MLGRDQAERVRRRSGTPSRRMRSHTMIPPIGPRTITAIEYFQRPTHVGGDHHDHGDEGEPDHPVDRPGDGLARDVGVHDPEVEEDQVGDRLGERDPLTGPAPCARARSWGRRRSPARPAAYGAGRRRRSELGRRGHSDLSAFPTVDVVLEARGLVKDYRRARAVDGVDLDVHAGERVALLGPNGAGKTTTLLMLLGVIAPDAGSVRICGRPIAGDRSHAAEEVGFAAGYLPLAERLRVREYLTLFGNLYGLADPAPAIAAGLARFRVEHLADAMGTELSSGQRTLVGIVRATLHRPRLLVLDEPTASLDPDVSRRVRAGSAGDLRGGRHRAARDLARHGGGRAAV